MNRPVEDRVTIWFIQAADRVWGPYPSTRMASFVQEGRVAADTLVAARAEGPFAPAAHQLRLRGLFGPVEAAERTSEQEPGPERQAQAHVQSKTGVPLPLLVFTTLRGARADGFEGLLGAHGPYVRVQPGLWLVMARMTPASLRNVLTRRMEAGDSVMVVTAPPTQAAWFNLDGETDRALRQLWMG